MGPVPFLLFLITLLIIKRVILQLLENIATIKCNIQILLIPKFFLKLFRQRFSISDKLTGMLLITIALREFHFHPLSQLIPFVVLCQCHNDKGESHYFDPKIIIRKLGLN